MSDRPEARAPSGDGAPADVLDRITDAVFALDDDWRFTYLNERAADLLERDPDELLGAEVWEAFPEAAGSAFQREYERAMAEQEPVTFEEFYPPLDAWFEVRAYPSESGLSVYFRDVTERVRNEDQLRERERALRAAYTIVADPDRSFRDQVESLLTVVRETLGVDYATLSRVRGDDYLFEVVDAPADADVDDGDVVPLDATNCERVVAEAETLVLEDIEAEAPDLADRPGNEQLGVSCYLGAPVTVDEEVYGTFCFYDEEARTEAFADWEVTFVELLSNWVGQELDRQRYVDVLAALNELHEVVRDVTDAAIAGSTREEIESIACRRLADAESYELAWVGEVDPATGEIEPRAEAGADGYLDGVTLAVDDADEPTDAGGTGLESARFEPAAAAVLDEETRVVQNVRTDAGDGPLGERAAEYGFRSAAAVPIAHEGTVYGVLSVYAPRPTAFEGEERAVVEQLGALLGHAIASVDRKRALTSDAVVELEFRIRGALDELGVTDPPDEPIVFEEVVPLPDDEFLVYGSTSEAALETLAAVADREPHWRSLAPVGDRPDGVDFELRLSEPPLLSTVASLGGRVQRAVVDEGDYRLTVHLPPSADVRQLADAIHEAFPDATLVSQHHVTRPDEGAERLEAVLSEELTDRQRAALRAAYFGGHFEWPRERTAEEVAERLGVSGATFHEHLRAAERKVFGALLEGAADEEGAPEE